MSGKACSKAYQTNDNVSMDENIDSNSDSEKFCIVKIKCRFGNNEAVIC